MCSRVELFFEKHFHTLAQHLKSQLVLVYTTSTTPRLRYIFDLMLTDLVGIEFEITHDVDKFIFYNGPKFNYSEKQFGEELFFFATQFLFEKKIKQQDLSVLDWQDTKAFFATHPKYVLPFDPFAASFYMVSRYEEYLPFTKDKHERFDAAQSMAFQKGFLHKPIVNIYAKKIREILSEAFPKLNFREQSYRYVSTIDIDNAWAFKEKGFLRTTGAFLRSLSRFDFTAVVERLSVILNKKPDPYYTYDHLFEIQNKYKIDTIYFFLLGDYAENDKNVSGSRKKFQSLIKQIADYCEIGIHPSYASNQDVAKLFLEKKRLEKIVRRNITKSRQHFLKMKLPDTYHNLIEYDITDDYTMGFSGEIGFRAGICSPFYFYDLSRDTPTRLRIHPFAVMDATLRFYMKVQPAEVMSYVGPLIKEVKAVNGTFMSLWHNESISDIKPWEGWKEVYEDIVKAAHKN